MFDTIFCVIFFYKTTQVQYNKAPCTVCFVLDSFCGPERALSLLSTAPHWQGEEIEVEIQQQN